MKGNLTKMKRISLLDSCLWTFIHFGAFTLNSYSSDNFKIVFPSFFVFKTNIERESITLPYLIQNQKRFCPCRQFKVNLYWEKDCPLKTSGLPIKILFSWWCPASLLSKVTEPDMPIIWGKWNDSTGPVQLSYWYFLA